MVKMISQKAVVKRALQVTNFSEEFVFLRSNDLCHYGISINTLIL